MTSRERVAVVLFVAAALLLRAAVLWSQAENLSVDVDAYLGIAHSLADGNGYSTPGSGTATAYRPPLYPLALAGILKLGGGSTAIGLLHLLLGTATVFLTFVVGRRLGLGRAAFAAAALVALDPLLLRYTTLPMTETVFTFLVISLVAVSIRTAQSRSAGPEGESRSRRFRQATIGFVFGLCALCRPTIWVFGLAACVWWLWKETKWAKSREFRKSPGFDPPDGWCSAFPWPVLLAAVVTVSPWLARNLIVFGRPILATTHGGYTLLLGNNPVFYREVVARPWGTVWQATSLCDWSNSLESDISQEVPTIATEPDRDRWMYRRARRNITDDPETFLRACWLRFRRFWNVAPLGPAGEAIPAWARWAVAGFYVVVTTGLIVGTARLKRAEWRDWMPLVLLLVSFCVVHLFFWSNTRMRAPLVPAIALLAARGWLGRGASTDGSRDAGNDNRAAAK